MMQDTDDSDDDLGVVVAVGDVTLSLFHYTLRSIHDDHDSVAVLPHSSFACTAYSVVIRRYFVCAGAT